MDAPSARSSGSTSQKRRVLVYAPEGMVTIHLATLVTVARCLSDQGHDVYMPRCNGLFERCVSMDSVTLPSNAAPEMVSKFCANCLASHDAVMADTDLHGVKRFDLGLLISQDIKNEARRIVDATPDPRELAHDGVLFGAMCLHDLLLSYKLMKDTPLQDWAWRYLRQYLNSTLATYLALSKLFASGDLTDLVVYGQYAANIAAVSAAQRWGANSRLITAINHRGVDRRFLHVNKHHYHLWYSSLIADWPTCRDFPLTPTQIREIGHDIIFRLSGNGVQTYSPGRTGTEIHSRLNLDQSKKLIVAYTSSLDEYNAEDQLDIALGAPPQQPPKPFVDQIDWLTFMVDHVRGRDDLQFVIRIHPREDANKRDNLTSQHLTMLRAALTDLPPNVRVVWPRDPVSSYDLMEVANQVQAWSSTVGLEAARLGVPVLKANRGYSSYPEGDFVMSSADREEFGAMADSLMEFPPTLERLIFSHRYYACSRFNAALDLGDIIGPTPFKTWLTAYRRPKRMEDVERAFFSNEPIWRWKQADETTDQLSLNHEAMLVMTELRRVLHFLITGTDLQRDVRIVLNASDTPILHPVDGEAVLQLNSGRYVYRFEKEIYSRYSPLCVRLARLCAIKCRD